MSLPFIAGIIIYCGFLVLTYKGEENHQQVTVKKFSIFTFIWLLKAITCGVLSGIFIGISTPTTLFSYSFYFVVPLVLLSAYSIEYESLLLPKFQEVSFLIQTIITIFAITTYTYLPTPLIFVFYILFGVILILTLLSVQRNNTIRYLMLHIFLFNRFLLFFILYFPIFLSHLHISFDTPTPFIKSISASSIDIFTLFSLGMLALPTFSGM